MSHLPNIRSRFGLSNKVSCSSLPTAANLYNRSLEYLDRDDAEAFRLNELAAAEGMHDAVLAMGWFYLNGVGVRIDEDEAVRWYRKSARQGETRAMFSLGQIAYEHGEFTDALTWFSRAKQKGHHRSQYWIGKMYWRGYGVEQDRRRAWRMIEEAAFHKVDEAQRVVRYFNKLVKSKRKA